MVESVIFTKFTSPRPDLRRRCCNATWSPRTTRVPTKVTPSSSGMTLATLLLSICVFEYRCVQIELSVRKVVLFPTNCSKPTVGALFIRMTAECLSIFAPLESSKSLCELPTTAHVLKLRLYLGVSFSISLEFFPAGICEFIQCAA